MQDDNRLVKLKARLADTIQEWIHQEADSDGWDALDTYVGDFTAELMADSAFNILLAQSDLYTHLRDQGLLKEDQ